MNMSKKRMYKRIWERNEEVEVDVCSWHHTVTIWFNMN